MKARPILFNTDMVREILAGQKTQTRRMVKLPKDCYWLSEEDGTWIDSNLDHGFWHAEELPCPFGEAPFNGQHGDLLIPALRIPGLDRRYCADINGHIWSRAKGEWRQLEGCPNSRGYLTVTPAVDGKYKTRTVHSLVASAFYGEKPEDFPVIRHLDGDQLNNSPENLDYGTIEDNWSDRAAHCRGVRDSHHAAKLTSSLAQEIRAMKGIVSQRELARTYGVAQSQVWSVMNGRTWGDASSANPANMPRWASRLTLEITDVRVERLQDISEEDARSEGIQSKPGIAVIEGKQTPSPVYFVGGLHPEGSPSEAFRSLWSSIYSNWHTNPWIWVVEYKVHHCNVDALLRERETEK